MKLKNYYFFKNIVTNSCKLCIKNAGGASNGQHGLEEGIGVTQRVLSLGQKKRFYFFFPLQESKR